MLHGNLFTLQGLLNIFDGLSARTENSDLCETDSNLSTSAGSDNTDLDEITENIPRRVLSRDHGEEGYCRRGGVRWESIDGIFVQTRKLP